MLILALTEEALIAPAFSTSEARKPALRNLDPEALVPDVSVPR